MSGIVAKQFNTTHRRMRVNTIVSETDDLTPHTYADLKTRGFIKDAEQSAPAEVAAESVAPKSRPAQRAADID